MATYVSAQDGNFSTAAVWNKVVNTPTLHASTNITPTTTGVFSATFTAPNTTNASTGCVVYCTSSSGSGSWTATLQEDIGGTGSWLNTTATATIAHADLLASCYLYFAWGTPYVYATTGAGRYRIKLTVSSTSSGSVAADSGAANFCYLTTDNATATPTTGDDIYICPANASGTRTITVTGTSNLVGSGSGVIGAALPTTRELNDAVRLEKGALLVWDTTADATLQVKGAIYVNNGGELQMGTIASPMPAGITAKLIWDSNGVSGLAGCRLLGGGKLTLQGNPSPDTTNWKAAYVSGDGTTATPITVPSGWSVGDHVCITGKDAYDHQEYKYIKTKPTTTTATFSDTAGGVESGLSFTHHTYDELLNIGRNVVWSCTNLVDGWYFYNGSATANNVNVKWFRAEYAGTSNTNKNGFFIYVATTTVDNTSFCDYSVAWQPRYEGFVATTTKGSGSHTGLIACGNNPNAASNVGGIVITTANNKTWTDLYVVGLRRMGILVGGAGHTYNNLKVIGNNQVGAAATTPMAGLVFSAAALVQLNNVEVQANRSAGINTGSTGAVATTFVNLVAGTHGDNTIDLYTFADVYNTIFFNSASMSSTTTVSNYLNLIPGSSIAFQDFGATANDNFYYTAFGSASASGASLSDTTVRTPGSLAFRIAPEDATNGFEWDVFVPVDAHNTATFQAYFGANTALAGDATATARVELWLPGSLSADATSTIALTDITGGASWESVSISAQYTGDSPGNATVKVFCLSTTANAYLYVDDTFNAGNTVVSKDPVTGLDVWTNGQLTPVLSPSIATQGYIASAVWGANTADYVQSGSMGLKENQGATKGDIAALD